MLPWFVKKMSWENSSSRVWTLWTTGSQQEYWDHLRDTYVECREWDRPVDTVGSCEDPLGCDDGASTHVLSFHVEAHLPRELARLWHVPPNDPSAVLGTEATLWQTQAGTRCYRQHWFNCMEVLRHSADQRWKMFHLIKWLTLQILKRYWTQ